MRKSFNLFLILILFLSVFGCSCTIPHFTFGVWWWDDTLGDKYFEFVKENGVNEIYYCSDNFDAGTNLFIKEANDVGIKVYYLAGEYKWLSDSTNLHEKIDKYINYQSQYSNKFSGIHLDIEPHQDPDFDIKRSELIINLINLANELKIRYSDITFDYDLPFWLEDIVSVNGEEKEAYKHMIDVADRIFLMSYRDDAEKIYEISKDEIEYAKSVNKKLVLGVETKSSEGDNVSFEEEGKEYMYEELYKLKRLIPKDFGLVIHHVKTWYELKD